MSAIAPAPWRQAQSRPAAVAHVGYSGAGGLGTIVLVGGVLVLVVLVGAGVAMAAATGPTVAAAAPGHLPGVSGRTLAWAIGVPVAAVGGWFAYRHVMDTYFPGGT